MGWFDLPSALALWLLYIYIGLAVPTNKRYQRQLLMLKRVYVDTRMNYGRFTLPSGPSRVRAGD